MLPVSQEMSFLEVNVESIFIARVCLGLAGLTHAGHWGAHCLRLVGLMRVVRLFGFDFGRRAPRGCEASSFWYASSTGPVGPTRVVMGFRRGGRDLFWVRFV